MKQTKENIVKSFYKENNITKKIIESKQKRGKNYDIGKKQSWKRMKFVLFFFPSNLHQNKQKLKIKN